MAVTAAPPLSALALERRPSLHTEQYFETNGSRALYKDGWMWSCRIDRIPWRFDPPTLARLAPGHWNPDDDPCELYDLRTLWEIASTNPWLSVTPVSEHRINPPWASQFPDVTPPRGLHVRQTGILVQVAHEGAVDLQHVDREGPQP